ncbi:NnrS family protein [Citreimonas salinaria]|uniref:Uncharacterized protein involved in response to NO n=1 Tax=Citreimonas salinaria TaxID=321339 RepID=A0A1H3P2W6_9RHOB|nr:NnrS family protein [Citreimonas salinaria]SDY94759.1 uncharacterized protein involved in response to NO [Citreimonas salinaria]
MSAAWRELRGARIFFPLALSFAALWIPIWQLRHAGILPGASVLWHGHEMIYGYLAAMVAGFLTVGDRGPRILVLAALWIAARLLLHWDALPVLSALVDLSFLPLLLALRRPALWSGRKFMSLGIACVVGALTVANAWMFLEPAAAFEALRTAAMLAAALLVVVGGRLVPGHTRAATRRGPGLSLARTEWASVAVTAMLVLAEVSGAAAAAGAAAGALGLLQAYRLWHWWDRDVLSDPLLWGLHAGFGWLAIGLLAYSALQFGAGGAPGDALHLILVGAVGSLTLVIALRLIRAQAREAQRGDWKDGIVLALISLAALLRGGVPLVAPDLLGAAAATGGIVWSVAMLLALALYAPRLLGRPKGAKA